METRRVGIREFKAKATQIVREVRESRAEYVITHRGKPAALLVPLSDTDDVDPTKVARLFGDIETLADEIAALWPADVSSVDALREDRREL